ncbi:multidrug transporter AcrB [Kordiimonas sediminis]|uniref:Multidrug transporter AcrB n=1 Tax=Kordiimonas sediminis TaxID=1735581 RepID=A0A919E401_9PROT|nr:efflux RND transporter permease subunit [Kordiimonas sediminis]GHF17455.1 multidrug transporter AcrB [Kordiimonas sediminis]
MKTLIDVCLRNRVAANLLAALIIVSGLISFLSLEVRLFPELVLRAISVTVPYPGATPAEVETSIVKPIEERLEGMEGVQKITALAATGVASVVVKLEEDAVIQELKDDIQAEIDRITVFPQRSERPVVAHMEPEELAARIILYGDTDRETLKQVADRIRTNLVDLPDISRVGISGVPEYLIDISISKETLESLGVSLLDISDRVAKQSLDLSGGNIEEERQKILVRSVGERRTEAEFKTIVLGASSTGTPVYLSDIASITDGLSESPQQALYKGKPAAYVSIYRVGDEQQLDLAEAVRDYYANDIEAVLPEGVQAEFWRDNSVMLEERIDLLTSNALLGLMLVGGLLMIFLDIRIAAWVAFGVGVSFVGAGMLMNVFDVSINQLSLFGFILAIGIVVDDAIVVGENIHAERREHTGTAMEAARSGVLRVYMPILFSVSTTIVAFVPLLFLPGTFGQFIGPIAAVVIIVLVLSLTESLLILPRHLAHLRSGKPRRWSPRRLADPVRDYFAAGLRHVVEARLRPTLKVVIANPLATVLVAFGLFFASMSLMTSGAVKFVFFPEVEGDYVNVTLELPETSSQEQTIHYLNRIVDGAEKAAKRFEQSGIEPLQGIFWVLGVSPIDGTGRVATDGGAMSNKGYVVARIQEASERTFNAQDFIEEWRGIIGEIPGAQKLTYSADLVSPGAPVYFEISTRLADDTKAAVLAIRKELEKLPGVYDIRDDRFRTTDEVKIEIKPLALSYGLTQNELARQVRAAFFGSEATRVQRDREEIQVRVRLPKDERYNLEALKSLRIKVGDGFVPVTNLADIRVEPADASITRIDGRQIYTLTSEVDTSVTTAGIVTDHILNTVAPSLQDDFDGLHITLSGDQEEQAEMGPVIVQNFLIALMVIYSLLALNFRSYSQPIIVMIAIPFGFMGAILGHAILGMNLTLLSIFGVIGLSGVIINNSLMVITFVNERLDAGEDYLSAILEGTLERFRAILLTTLTTFLGVAPIILETSVQAQFLIPTAVSLGFGIVIGTTVLILTVPALTVLHYKVFGRKS